MTSNESLAPSDPLREALARLRADLETHDSGGLAYAATDCESIALVRADDLRIALSALEAAG